MDGREFVKHLFAKHYAELEGPVTVLRRALAELEPAGPAFVSLMQRQAKREQAHGIALTRGLLQYRGDV